LLNQSRDFLAALYVRSWRHTLGEANLAPGGSQFPYALFAASRLTSFQNALLWA
jgi:hypothetical protein